MKIPTVILVILSILVTCIVVSAEGLSIEQTVPFGMVIESTDLYKTISTKSSVGKASPGLICQIVSIERLGGEEWYKVKCFADGSEVTGCIIGRYVRQMTVSELITVMSDPSIAEYMQSFVGFAIISDYDNDLAIGSRSTFSDTLMTPMPTATPEPIDAADYKTYILNLSSWRFHYPNCKGVKTMSEKNKSEFTGTREQLIAMGFKPCGDCKP